MKLSRLYSNFPDKFPAIAFRRGLNVVLAEIRNPENLSRDTHNLGKTTLAALIDFCLLKGRSPEFFLFRHENLFRDFVFFLELLLTDGSFVTIRRSVREASKIGFYYSAESQETVVDLDEDSWNHWRVPFEKSKSLLDGVLSMAASKPWSFRRPLGYALRLQNDYRDVFKLDANRGPHSDWKPFLAQLIGLDGKLIGATYDVASDVAGTEKAIGELESQLSGLGSSPDRLDGVIMVQSREVEELSEQVERFDFRVPEKEVDDELVTKIERSISALNERRYHLRMSLSTIKESLDETIGFDLNSVEKLFDDAQVYFGNQLKHDYQGLLRFLKSISAERRALLSTEVAEIEGELEEISVELSGLNERRVKALAALREVETFQKYRQHNDRLVDLRTTLRILEGQREQMERLTTLQQDLSKLTGQLSELIDAVRKNISSATQREGTYRKIRVDFSEIVKSVLDRKAVISSELNKEDHIVFSAEILDDSGVATSADLGYTFKKLLCIAFDIAVFRSYLDQSFVRFVFHDGALESLDDRKKLCLIDTIRASCNDGLQQIVTLIDSDLPVDSTGRRVEFEDEEIVRLLHDEGSDGRLFRMERW